MKDWSESFGAKLAEWRDNPVLFVQEALSVEYLARWQQESLQAVSQFDRIAIRSGHGVGKTTFLAWLVLWWELTRLPNKVAVTANRQDQLSDVVWAEIAHWHRKLHPALRDLLEVTADKVQWISPEADGFAVARTARKEAPEAFQGFHSPHMLFIADEASGIDDVVFEVGQGAMSTTGAKTVLTGNPTRTSGYFFNAFHTARHRWWTRRVSCLELIDEGAPWVSADYPAEVAEEYGEESNVFRYRVLGDFAKADDDAVIPLHAIEAAVDRDIAISGRCVWGLDVARFGDDRTALAKRQGNTVLEPAQAWRGKDLMTVCGIVKADYDATREPLRPEMIMVDTIGLGAGVADRLRELGLPVLDVNVSESAPNDDRFVRLRDELWWLGREWFLEKRCVIPDDPALIGELSSPTYTYTSSGKIKVESKDDMKKRGVKSPDIADAFLITFALNDLRDTQWFRPIDYEAYIPKRAYA